MTKLLDFNTYAGYIFWWFSVTKKLSDTLVIHEFRGSDQFEQVIIMLKNNDYITIKEVCSDLDYTTKQIQITELGKCFLKCHTIWINGVTPVQEALSEFREPQGKEFIQTFSRAWTEWNAKIHRH